MFSIHKKETVPMPKRGPNRLQAEQEKEQQREKEQAERVQQSMDAQEALQEVKAAGRAARKAQEEREAKQAKQRTSVEEHVVDVTPVASQEESPISKDVHPSVGTVGNDAATTNPIEAVSHASAANSTLGNISESKPVTTNTNTTTAQNPSTHSNHAGSQSGEKQDIDSRQIFNSAHRQHASSHQDAVAMFAQGSQDNVAKDHLKQKASKQNVSTASSLPNASTHKDTRDANAYKATPGSSSNSESAFVNGSKSRNVTTKPSNVSSNVKTNGAKYQATDEKRNSHAAHGNKSGISSHTSLENSAENGLHPHVPNVSPRVTAAQPRVTASQLQPTGAQPAVTHFGDGFPDEKMRLRPFDRDLLPLSGASEPDVRATTTFIDSFYSELVRCGVTEAVVSDGPLCHSLVVKALEHFGDAYAISDERSAAFFALGLAKTTANPVVVICDGNGDAANWIPAMLEASADHVPLIFIAANRPSIDGHTAAFVNTHAQLLREVAKYSIAMPVLPSKEASEDIGRQKALEACVQAHGLIPGARACAGGPVYIEFTLKDTMGVSMRSTKISESSLPPTVVAGQGFVPRNANGLFSILHRVRVVAFCGEGTCSSPTDADSIIEFAHRCNVPLLADSLSGLRNIDDPMIIDAYNAVLESNSVANPDVIIQMGQRPVSEEACRRLRSTNAFRIVVGMTGSVLGSSREIFVRSTPVVFAATMASVQAKEAADEAYAKAWQKANQEQRIELHGVRERDDINDLELGYVDTLAKLIPDDSTLFCGSGTPLQMMDEMLERGEHRLDVLANHGLDGQSGTLSTAFGAAQCSAHTTVLLDANQFAQDMNAIAIQLEISARANRDKKPVPSIVVVCLDRDDRVSSLPAVPHTDSGRMNDSGACIDLKHVCIGMGASYRHVMTNHELHRVYPVFAHEPGVHVIDIRLPKNPPLF